VTAVPRRGLQIDDPLASSQPGRRDEPLVQSVEHTRPQAAGDQRAPGGTSASPGAQPGKRATSANKSRPASARDPEPSAGAAAGRGQIGLWRAWSGISGVPHELLVELSDTARELELPIGMIVIAAITQLLDQPAEQIAQLVDRADDARIHGRRNFKATSRRTDRAVTGVTIPVKQSPVRGGCTGHLPGHAGSDVARGVSSTDGVRSPANSGPAPLQRPGPDTDGGDPIDATRT
jgi:hypothetical protein